MEFLLNDKREMLEKDHHVVILTFKAHGRSDEQRHERLSEITLWLSREEGDSYEVGELYMLQLSSPVIQEKR